MESGPESRGRVKEIAVNRSQTRWAAFDLESLIEQNHPARMIWNLSGRFDLSRFEEQAKTREGEAGRPCWPARLLVSIWVYSYTMGIGSARAIERLLCQEPGLRWLSADQEINHHTLADFRVAHGEALQHVFAQFLTLLETVGLVDLKTLLQDGTKVRAVAGRGSLHRRKTLEQGMRRAQQVVKKMEAQPESEGGPQGGAIEERRQAAQKRAAREALERAEAALAKLKKLEQEAAPSKREGLRVSESEPEARNMKQPDGGWGPSYNVQVTTEARSRMIVAVQVTTAANDTQQLIPALEKVKQNCGRLPEKIIADNGYATRDNVEKTSERGVEMIAPWKQGESREAGACKLNHIQREFAPSAFRVQRGGKKLLCPAGKTLVVIEHKVHHGLPCQVFEARAVDCRRCRYRRECCGRRSGPRRITRVVESEAMKQYLKRMKQPATKELYARRSEIAEFPHLWIKAVKRWRRFSVRGAVKAGIEALWVALAYNIAQWIRLRPAEALR